MSDMSKLIDVQPGWLIETKHPAYYGTVREIQRGVGCGLVRIRFWEGDGTRDYRAADRAIVHRAA